MIRQPRGYPCNFYGLNCVLLTPDSYIKALASKVMLFGDVSLDDVMRVVPSQCDFCSYEKRQHGARSCLFSTT